MSEIRNRVAESNLITIDMKSFKGSQQSAYLDISPWLFKGMILKEKVFRNHLESENWKRYQDKFVAIYCSNDVIIPIWAFMLITKNLKPYTNNIIFGDKTELENKIFEININTLDLEKFQDKRILIKGCAKTYIPEQSYIQVTNKLLGTVKSLMFGEACSNVPIFKN